MKNEDLLKVMYDIISNSNLVEKTQIKHFLNELEVPESSITVKEIEEKKFILPFRLSNKKYLLVEDFPINFILSYGVLIGERVKLVEFELFKKKHISSIKIFEKIKEKFNISDYKNIEVSQIIDLKYYSNFSKPNIISENQKILLKNKKIDLFKTKLISSNEISNFVPNQNLSHLSLAMKFNMSLKRLISKSFILNTKVHFNDYIMMRKYLNPIYEEDVVSSVFFDLDFNRLYQDISIDYYLKFDSNNICEQINKLNEVNFSKINIIKSVLKIDLIKINSDKGKYLVPAWKNNFGFLKIKDKNEFQNFAGIDFDLVYDHLETIEMMDSKGNTCEFNKKTFKDEVINWIFLKESETIEFSSPEELIVKLIFHPNIKNAYFREDETKKPLPSSINLFS